MEIRQEIDYHLKQAFREVSLALRADQEFARAGHLAVALRHSEIVERLRQQLAMDEQEQQQIHVQNGVWG
jgi:hypothetical protein